MKHEFKFVFYTTEDLSNDSTTQKFFNLLADSFVNPISYDSVEKTKKQFSEECFKEASKIYSDEGILFVKGEEDGFLAFLSKDPRGLSIWTLFLDKTALNAGKLEKWINFSHKLVEQFNLLYGFGVHVEEYDAKHLELTKFPGGGRIRKTIGVSTLDFIKYLPGVYWFTVFGRELTEFFNDSFGNLDEKTVKVTKLKNGKTSLRLKLSLNASHLDLKIKQEREIAEQLGEEYFFDREKIDKVRFKQVPNLTQILELEAKY